MVGLEDLLRVGDGHAGAGEGAPEALGGGGPGAGFAVRGGDGLGVLLRGEGAVAQFVAVLLLAAAVLVFLREAGLGEAHQLVEDGEFELELDGVNHRFDGGFVDVLAGEFEADEDDVHADADAVDQEELEHHFARHAVVDGAEEADGGGDVDG